MIKLFSVAIFAGLFFASHQRAPDPNVVQVCLTQWFDRDNPSGLGDWETLSELREENPGKICRRPTAIDAQTLNGISAAATGDVIFEIDTTAGFVCKNDDQNNKRMCNDYRVRFICPPTFCEERVCLTPWFDRDNPSGTGDWELLSDLREENPGQICETPVYIEVVTTDDNTPATSTGDIINTYSPTVGFVCLTQDEPSRECRDYKVRFGCPC